MKKSSLLNSELSRLVATLGHTDEITICDAGLPVPQTCQRIDMALTPGVPGFIETVKAMLSELKIEGVVMAEEFAGKSPELHQALLTVLDEASQETGQPIEKTYMPHEAFKDRTRQSRAIVRTGEFTPYANVVFQVGVVF
ncbi:D-ribose pyranase [Vibrio aerogenes CECT 7868]|uniref:D-ribose pyranase n=1 Tax=Vibrio aerogenes CECT 7868 TaxID=1216006 RepID=A0A1M6A0Q2_9VIBR|nr:D-ribose pyranase [Vibrio aerogenes]SHI30050.1 D-ribose pyranase [Vibrio aerogenes CECT 7868]